MLFFAFWCAEPVGSALDLEDYHPSLLLHCWLGHLTCKIVSKMTYNVSSGTLNPTISILSGDVFKSWPVDWLKVLRPTDTKTGHFGVVTITSNTGAQLEHSLCTTASKLLKVHCLIAAKVRRNRDHVGASEPPLIVDHRCHGFCPTHRNTHPSVYSTWTTKVVDNKRMV